MQVIAQAPLDDEAFFPLTAKKYNLFTPYFNFLIKKKVLQIVSSSLRPTYEKAFQGDCCRHTDPLLTAPNY